MKTLIYLYAVFKEYSKKDAIVYMNSSITYENLLENINHWKSIIADKSILPEDIVALNGDFTPNCISVLFALIENGNIIVPFDYRYIEKNKKNMELACANKIISFGENDQATFYELRKKGHPELYRTLHKLSHPGLVLFTSGTSGEPKAVVHDFVKLLEKFEVKKKALRTLNFLLFDHWGGLNTMFHTLSNGGTVIALRKREPQVVCSYIEKHRIEILPASPTFLNLLLLSEEFRNYDLSSLQLITYGTEPMPEHTLKRLKGVFPYVRLQQTYGLIELGVLRSKSKSNDSLWVKIGGEGYDTRVVDGLLEIKADSAMLGYLNAPSPFTEDGWFKTGDKVETDGEYLKILGRESEIINVGGEKVYPAEVESVIQEMDNVAEVTVFKEKNPLIGNIVCAKVRLLNKEDKKEVIFRIKQYCRSKLQSFKVPVRVHIDDEKQYGERFKKRRA